MKLFLYPGESKGVNKIIANLDDADLGKNEDEHQNTVLSNIKFGGFCVSMGGHTCISVGSTFCLHTRCTWFIINNIIT